MNREEIQKLLGGYATGTLTPEERQALFAAALEDQDLFDALGREQALRDLLRDPAAKAELLAVLDAPSPGGGFWEWLRRPMVASLAAACVAGIAIVGVWQATRNHLPAAVIVAELKVEQAKGIVRAPTEMKPHEETRVAPQKQAVRLPKVGGDSAAHSAIAAEMARRNAAEKALKDITPAVNAPVALPAAPPAPPPPAAVTPAPTRPAGIAETVEVTASASLVQAPTLPQTFQMGALQDSLAKEKLTLDARTLFYGNAFARRDNALTSPLAAGTAGAQSSAPKVASASVLAGTGNFAKQQSAASLGVRVSLLRGGEEVPVATVLNSGDTVRLKVTPNEDGFLYVATRDGTVWSMVASGPAQRLKPFETPPLPFTGSGRKLLYVMLSRQAQTLSPQSLAGLVRTNMVETLAEQDRATYVVAGLQDGAPQQVVQPIALTYR